MIKEILADDPLEVALIRAEAEKNVLSIDADGYTKMLDSSRIMEKMVAYLSLSEKGEEEHVKQTGTTTPNDQLLPSASSMTHEVSSSLKGSKYQTQVLTHKAHIPIHQDDQEKTTFTCPYGTFAYMRMTIGMCNASATFQRCMMYIFTDLIRDIMEVFMDDFSVYGSSFSVCLSNFCMVLQRCEEKHLVLNWEKCHFMVIDGIVLGHKISEQGIEVDKAKIEVMMGLQLPILVKGIRSFVGHAGFYQEVQHKDCLDASHTIKGALVSIPIVQPPDWDLPFEILTDACDYAVGAVLGQRKDKKLHMIYLCEPNLG
ncbi:hypothetical protein N665_0021s0024 [Sinapis alba]|nr:hypothetical protein N665_0021s0024 [Sinapis alba]